jgi:putative hydrolase of the HAD superfamily
MIRAVFFDLDGTLYDRDALVGDVFAAQHDLFRSELGGVSKGTFVRRLLELDAHGYGSKEVVYQVVADEWGLSQGSADRLLSHFWSAYDGNLRGDAPVVCPGALDDTRTTLECLRRYGKKLAVITNGGTVRQHRKLELLGLGPLFDAVLISESEGVRKPEPEIFHRALARCGVEAQETMFVGDHPKVDIAGANGAGLIPVWKFVPYWTLTTENVRTVHRLTEILPLCDAATSMP